MSQVDFSSIREDHEFRKEVLLEELRVVSSSIQYFDQKSMQIRHWCLTMLASSWTYLLTNDDVPSAAFYLLVSVPALFFVLDVQIKRNQMKFRYRSSIINRWINNYKAKHANLELFDPAGGGAVYRNFDDPENALSQEEQDAYREDYEKFISRRRAIRRSSTVSIFYVSVALLVVGGATLQWMVIGDLLSIISQCLGAE